MKFGDNQIAGTLFILGSLQFILCMLIAESIYPGYSVSKNFISDLGVGPTAPLFNSSIILFGISLLASSFFINRLFKYLPVTILLLVTSLGVIGVGIFPENIKLWHFIASFIAFFFGATVAIVTYKLEKPPLSYLSVVLGLISLASLVLFVSGIHLGLGIGGIERMIAYPTLLWAIAFGGYLISCQN
ncbi:MAG: DUF998 domain-containing protein [Candidatus Micrarchaeota archaeon]|nr:DUF998 domain-containing protein [Candidatus Micrarchaeota archaeon]